ncbi:MAG: hypothetical protein IH830_03070 [Planctomycetes bacterium]|nr:hypothetical protein [Planctomycetota bacterium]
MHPVTKLADALDEIVTAGNLLIPPHRPGKTAADADITACLAAAREARGSVKGVARFLRPCLDTQPGQWTTDLRALLARVGYMAERLVGPFAPEPSYIREFQRTLSQISARSSFLRDLDLSVDDDSLALHDACFPGTTDPIPLVMTATEVVHVLRLDILTTSNGSKQIRSMADALQSLDHLVRTGRLVPRRFSKSRVFDRADVLKLVSKVSI